ncbi:hypothetical protein ACW5W4_05825 [Aeromonas crassostreae]
MNRQAGLYVAPLLGALVALSWWLLPGHGLWARWDMGIFRGFNVLLAEPGPWRLFMAITNHRLFDLVSLSCMVGMLLTLFLRSDGQGRARWVAMGLLMVVTALLLNRIGHLIPLERPSPTLSMPGALRLTTLIDFPTKDASSDSFPGDHGLMLMIFATFMLRFAPRWMGWAACAMVVLFTLPRIMVGAHWFTDIYMGSLSISLIMLPWLLLTPLCERVLAWLTPQVDRLFGRWWCQAAR